MKNLLVLVLAFVALIGAGCESQTMDDAGITSKVKSKLAADSRTSAIDIKVDTNRGVVTLSGTAAGQAEKTSAGELAKNTEGVRGVVNNITVTPESSTARTDDDADRSASTTLNDTTILTKIKSQYVADGIIGTNVDVTNGEVLIRGEVENAQEKTKAEQIARQTEGVRVVKNMLTIKKG